MELVQLPNKAPQKQDDGVTSETALEFFSNAPPEHSFADYQAAQGAKPARDTQSGQSTPASRDSRGTRDKRAAQDTQSALSQSQPASQAPDASDRDLNEEDEIAMQQALWQSRQQAQMQHADPTASSSAGGTAIQPKSIEEGVEEELARGQGFQEEASSLERLMCQRCLTSTEVDRLRTLNQMITANKDRVVELCESRARENQAKQARTSVMLASLRPLKPKPAEKPATLRADGSSAMPPPPVIVKHPPQTTQRGGMKAPPPVLDPPLPAPVNHPPTQQQPDGEQDSGQGPPPRSVPNTRFAGGSVPKPASPKGRSTDQGQRPLISPKARPPPAIVIPSQRSSQPGASMAAMSSPRSVATEDTAYLEDKLERKREAKRQWAKTQEGTRSEEEDPSKYQRKSHQQEEAHSSSRDTRRKRSKRDRSSSTETADDDNRSTSTRESRSRRHERSRRHRSRSRGDSRYRRRRRSESSDEGRRSRSDKRKEAHRSSRDRRRRDDSPSPSQQGEGRPQGGPSQQSQSQASQGQSKAQPQQPQSVAVNAPAAQANTAPAAPPAVAQPGLQAQPLVVGQAQAQAARQAQAQLLAAQAIGAPATNIPIAKAMPIQQQPQAQTMAQPLPRPVFPPSTATIQVPARPQAQQMSMPPGLGTELERTQAAQIQQLHQQMAQMEAQLRAVQPTATQRQSSHSASGNWGAVNHNKANGMTMAGKNGEMVGAISDGIPIGAPNCHPY